MHIYLLQIFILGKIWCRVGRGFSIFHSTEPYLLRIPRAFHGHEYSIKFYLRY